MPLSKRVQLSLCGSILTIALAHLATGVRGVDSLDLVAALLGFLIAFIALAVMECQKAPQ